MTVDNHFRRSGGGIGKKLNGFHAEGLACAVNRVDAKLGNLAAPIGVCRGIDDIFGHFVGGDLKLKGTRLRRVQVICGHKEELCDLALLCLHGNADSRDLI